MTDRLNTLVVVLEKPTRTDDVLTLISAIEAMRGVLSVESGEVNGLPGYGARGQERALWRNALTLLLRKGPATEEDDG